MAYRSYISQKESLGNARISFQCKQMISCWILLLFGHEVKMFTVSVENLSFW